MVRGIAVALALIFVLPASARAADVTSTDGLLRYTGAPGKTSNVNFDESQVTPGTVTITRVAERRQTLSGRSRAARAIRPC